MKIKLISSDRSKEFEFELMQGWVEKLSETEMAKLVHHVEHWWVGFGGFSFVDLALRLCDHDEKLVDLR